jgi:MFS family permease
LFAGVVSPSRDMLVRSVTPPGAFGRVFGFVSCGFNIGSMIAPMIYGLLMDHGEPRAVFLIAAACSILSIGTVVFGISKSAEKASSACWAPLVGALPRLSRAPAGSAARVNRAWTRLGLRLGKPRNLS